MRSSRDRRSYLLAAALLLAPRLAAAVDLTVTAVSGNPASLGAGKPFSLRNTVKASGGAASGFTVGLYLSSDATVTTSDTPIGSRTVASLASGASSAATTTVTIPLGIAAGTYYVGALADATRAVTESNESNNARTATGRLTAVKPHLRVESLAGAPASIGVGDLLTLTDTVVAGGTELAPAFTVSYYLAPDGATLRSGTFTIRAPTPRSMLPGTSVQARHFRRAASSAGRSPAGTPTWTRPPDSRRSATRPSTRTMGTEG